jgi:NADH dehydrogenase
MSSTEADLLILGASMLGIELVWRLRRAGTRLRTIVVDRQAEHPYIPLSHERLCGRLSAPNVLPTAAFLAADPACRFVQDEVVGFDAAAHAATLRSGDTVRGRFVVVALGSTLRPPGGLPGAERLLTLKSADQAARAREQLEALGDRSAPLAVIGGGISGVELAAELAHRAATRGAAGRVILLHAGERLLPGLTARAGRVAAAVLAGQGVEVRLRTRVLAVAAGRVRVRGADGEEEWLDAAEAFWGGGLAPPAIFDALSLPRTDDGWLAVGPTLQCFPTAVATEPEVFAAGDAARIFGADGCWPTMQRAIECIWQAGTLAQNLRRLAAETAGYPRGVPPLAPHVLREDFPHGVSLGAHSLIVYGRLVTDPRGVSVWFRRWLMRQYFARYRP